MEVLDLSCRKGLVVGIANEHSLAWAAAQHFRNAGGELAITYLNDKAKPFVEPLARQINADIFLPCDVPSQVSSRAYSKRSRRNGDASIFSSIRSPGHARTISTGVSSIAPPRVFRNRCWSPAIPSSAWRNSPSR